MVATIPVWLDCDPGHDDATAILLAGHTPNVRLLGVSTIGGNQTLAKVTQNALDVLDAIGLSHIDVVAGQPRPLMRPPMLCPEIHGDTGLDGPQGGRLLPRSPRRPLPGKAINVMYEAISAAWDELRQAAIVKAAAKAKEDAVAAPEAAAAAGQAAGITKQERGGNRQEQAGSSAAVAAAAHGQETGLAELAAPLATGTLKDSAPGRQPKAAGMKNARAGLAPQPGSTRVRLVCTGALTNAALLLTVYPEVVGMVEVVIMGGCLGIGNTGPVMEFNIQTDPEAAKIVFESGVELTMVPLEVTHTVLATPWVLAAIGGGSALGGSCAGVVRPLATVAAPQAALAAEALSASAVEAAVAAGPAVAPTASGSTAATATFAAIADAYATPPDAAATPALSGSLLSASSPFRHAIQQLLIFFAHTYKRVFHFQDPPLHDPAAVAYALRPDLFETRRMRVDVETLSTLSYGQTVCDVWGQSGRPANVNVALRVDAGAFWGLLLEAVARADTVSPLNQPQEGRQ